MAASFRLYPFPIRTPTGSYLYDPGSNEILRVDDELFHAAVQAFQSVDPGTAWEEVALPKASADELRAAQSQGILRNDEISILTFPTESDCDGSSQSVAPLFTIEVTDACNLQCKYCCYSGHFHFRRCPGKRFIDRSNLQKAIEWYLSQPCPQQKRRISFYGGEPLLCFDDLIWAAGYAKSVASHPQHLSFGLTTNGTLLSLERGKALIEACVHLSVSLDGDRTTHDWSRVDKLGRGSFDLVFQNLKALWQQFGEDLYSHVNLLAFLDAKTLGHDLMGWVGLLEREPWLSGFTKRVGFLGLNGKPEFAYRTRPVEDDASMFREALSLYVDSFVQTAQPGATFLHAVFDPNLRKIRDREICWIGSPYSPSGTCLPGTARLFLSLDGNLFPCERVDERFQIGTIGTGVEIERVRAFVNRWYQLSASTCNGCWAIRLCGRCPSEATSQLDEADALMKGCVARRRMYAFDVGLFCHVFQMDARVLETIR